MTTAATGQRYDMTWHEKTCHHTLSRRYSSSNSTLISLSCAVMNARKSSCAFTGRRMPRSVLVCVWRMLHATHDHDGATT
jgi:hypothetical protein